MDNPPVGATSPSVQDQNNSKSTAKADSAEMDTEQGNLAAVADSPIADRDSLTSKEPSNAPETSEDQKPDSRTSGSEDTPPASLQSHPASNPEPEAVAAQTPDPSALGTPTPELTADPTLSGSAATQPQPPAEAQLGGDVSEPAGSQPSDAGKEDSDAKSAAGWEGETSQADDGKERETQGTGHQESLSLPSPGTLAEASTPSKPLSDAPVAAAASESSPPTAGPSSVQEGGAAGGGGNSSPSGGESVYYVKWISFNSGKVAVVTQNENGPCPLLAVMNVLLLKGKVRLTSMVEMITSEQLMAHLGECVMESKPKNLDETGRANYEQNMQDAMDLMHKLQTGLDVNVKFTGVSDFEYTSECILFDLLQISLYHGWLVDPQNDEDVTSVGKCSYNQLVEKIIQNKQSDSDEIVREALIAEQFLDRTAAQLTYHGLCELSSTVKEQELCVFFRNNHFNTLYRHNNELFLLVTDQGFLTENNVVWETLSNVDGDCHFVDAQFCTYTKPPPSTDPIPNSPYVCGDEQINSDYQVALSLQHHDQALMAEQEAAWGQYHKEFSAAHNSDHELALRLQEEEDRRAAAALEEQRAQQGQGQAAGQGQGPPQGQAAAAAGAAAAASGDRRPREREERREKKEGKDCCIL